MSRKIPRRWTSVDSPETLEKKILRYIQLPGDKDFAASLYTRDDQGFFSLKTKVSPSEAKRITKLDHVIKKARGGVKTGKLFLLALILGALILFNILFKDRLIEGAMENAMEMIFKAKVEITGLRTSLFKGSLSFEALAIGDKDHPMTNLVETGPVTMDIRTWQLLRKKFVLEEASVKALAWGTPRTDSAALLPPPKASEKPKEKLLEKAVDTKALTEALLPDLTAPRLAEEYKQALTETNEKWDEKISSLESTYEALQADYQALESTDLSAVKGVAQAKDLLDKASSASGNLKKGRELLQSAQKDFSADKEALLSMKAALEAAVKEDARQVLALTGKGGPSLLFNRAAEEIIRQKTGKFSSLARSLFRNRDKIPSGKGSKTSPEPPPPPLKERKGLDIAFPVTFYPTVLAEHIGIDIRDGDRQVAGSVNDLSTHPRQWKNPVSFTYKEVSEKRRIRAEGKIDIRKGMEPDVRISFTGKGLSLDLDTPSSSLPALKSIHAVYQADGAIALADETTLSGRFLFTVTSLDLLADETADETQKRVFDILKRSPPFTLTVRAEAGPSGEPRISLSTSLTDILRKAATEEASREIARQQEKVEQEITSRISGLLGSEEEEMGLFNRKEALLGEKESDLLASQDALNKITSELKKKAAGSLLPFKL